MPSWNLSLLTVWLLKTVAVVAPLSAAQYAWITLRKVQTQGETQA